MSREVVESFPALKAYSGFVAATAELQKTQFDVAQTAIKTSWDIAESAGRLLDPAGILFRRRAAQKPDRAEPAAEPATATLTNFKEPLTANLVSDKDSADPIKHPELIAGEYNYVIPGVIKDTYPLKAYKEIARLSSALRPGESIKYNREIGSNEDRKVYKIVYYRGLPKPEDIETNKNLAIRKKPGVLTPLDNFDFQKYLNDPHYRSMHPNKPVDDIVKIQDSFSSEEFHMRYFVYDKVPEHRRYYYLRSALDNTLDQKRYISIAYDQYDEPIGTASIIDVSNDTNPATGDPAVDVRSDYRKRSVGSTLLTDMAGIAREQGLERLVFEIKTANSAISRLLFTHYTAGIKQGSIPWIQVKRNWNDGAEKEVEIKLRNPAPEKMQMH